MNPRLSSLLSWLLTLLTPFVLLGFGVRVVLLPAYLPFEYRTPNFPADDYGFTTADRLRWGTYGWDYIMNSADISYLGQLRFDDGSPVFNERELSHMHDVKGVVQAGLRLWVAALAGLLLLALWAWRASWWPAFRAGLMRGGWLTLGLAGTVGLVATAGASGSGELFWEFFSGFHALFFKGDTWLFQYSDTLIRLYPLRFWEDTLLSLGLIAAAGGLTLALCLRPLKKSAARGV